jgi:hypothetical protein
LEEKKKAEANPSQYATVMHSIVNSITQLTALYNNPSAPDNDIAAALIMAEQVTEAMKNCNSSVIADESFEGSAGLITGGEIVSDTTYGISNALKVTSSASGTFDETYLFDNADPTLSASQYGSNMFVLTEFEVKTTGFVSNEMPL